MPPALAQERIGGAIYLVNPSNNDNLNPLLCTDIICQQMGQLLFPTLFTIDPEQAIFAASSGEDNALALDWQTDDGLIYTFTLRDDLTWDDGIPVTAYDVFYSYLAIVSAAVNSPYRNTVSPRVPALLPLDARHLVVAFDAPLCDALDVLNFPVIPAHVFAPDFAESAQFDAENADYVGQLNAWREESAPDFGDFTVNLYNYTLPVTVSGYDVFEIRSGDSIRLTLQNEVGLYIYNRISTANAVDYFLNGALDVIQNPPYSRWNDILAADVEAFIYPGYTLDYIGFNLADPAKPRAYRDEDGNIQEQLPHPTLSDIRVRRAIQMGINVPALIDAAVQGYGTPIATNQPPGSWALNPDLTPATYDPEGAKRLLDEAGWKAAATSRGVRLCVGCLVAKPDTPLTLTMLVAATPEHVTMAALIVEQLGYIGMEINLEFTDAASLLNEIQRQTFDMYLTGMTFGYPANPHTFDAMFFIEEDRLNGGANATSYYNEIVVSLLEDARTYPGCNDATRGELYHQVQTILNEDLPYLWLFAPQEMVAVRGWVHNVQMYPYQPFWNLEQWAVNYVQG